MTASRDQRLAQLRRQIEQADFQCKSYARTLARAETSGDTPRVTEYDQRLADATVAARTLRLEWLQLKLEQCVWKASRLKTPDDRYNASEGP